MTRRTRTTAGALITTLVAAALVTAAPAFAGDGDDDEVIREGSCTGSTDWKVKAKSDDGRIEFEGEIDSNRNGQAWSWKIKHNGSVSAKGTSTTTGPSGSFEVERRLTNLAGTDQLVFKAKNPSSGEVCTGALAF